MQKEILEKNPTADVRVYAVWFNMIWTDSRAWWPKDVLTDPRVTHFWDRRKIVGRWYGRHAGDPDRYGVVWDAFFLYGPEARWNGTLTHLISSGGTIVAEFSLLRKNLLPILRERPPAERGKVDNIAPPG